MSTAPIDEQLYALFHVNRITGEKVRYPVESFPADKQSKVESSAQGSRIGNALGSAYGSDWETQALPDIPYDNPRSLGVCTIFPSCDNLV